MLKGPLKKNPVEAIQCFLNLYSNPALTWEELSVLRRLTRLPILLKGILHADDARQAVDRGVQGVIVSNHGGRQLDGAIAALDALPDVVAAVGDKTTVLFDSGIRRGPDVFKALALGARSVLVGRPYCFGLAVAGEEGVRQMLDNLLADFDLAMGLAGCSRLAEVTREMIVEARPIEAPAKLFQPMPIHKRTRIL
jgi:isopentenyl diphosphate isomerase/L-lactate dehydrogenase-like FMN-dependent dehydrogenase